MNGSVATSNSIWVENQGVRLRTELSCDGQSRSCLCQAITVANLEMIAPTISFDTLIDRSRTFQRSVCLTPRDEAVAHSEKTRELETIVRRQGMESRKQALQTAGLELLRHPGKELSRVLLINEVLKFNRHPRPKQCHNCRESDRKICELRSNVCKRHSFLTFLFFAKLIIFSRGILSLQIVRQGRETIRFLTKQEYGGGRNTSQQHREECNNECRYRCNCSPSFPPNDASIYAQFQTWAESFNQAHPLPLRRSRYYLATGIRDVGEPVTLANVKPPRELRTRLREDV